MAKKKSKESSIEELLETCYASEWCIVDTENNFTFQTHDYTIDKKVKQYQVLNKPTKKKNGQYNDWTNDASMTRVLAIDTIDEILFFDEKLNQIDYDLVKLG